MNYLMAILFFVLVLIIGIIPFWLLYVLANFLKFLIHRIFGYRLKVIEDNLRLCFPEIDSAELKRLVKLIYKNLADIFIEGVKAFTMTRRQVVKRHKLLNPELLTPYLAKGQSILGLTGHYTNWEWGSLSASLQINANVVAFYKKLNNPVIDWFIRKSRTKFGTTLAPIHQTSETFEAHISKTTIFLMAADQRTLKKNLPKSYWVNFMGQDTPFLHGPENYAIKYNLPVFYIDIQRVKRGFYEVELSLLVENPSELQPGEITNRYAQKLESIIRKQPENWLWSHRRWKIGRQNLIG
jgi:KDO2-lipid IV(A) lauroyltransferase